MRLIDADVLKEDLGRIITACKRRYSYKEIGFNLTQLDYIMTRIIDETPTIPPENLQPQWIPVTKRLPEERQPVYVRLANGNVFKAEIRTRQLLKEWWYNYDPADDDMDMLGVAYEIGEWMQLEPVVAWMQLPELCEAEQEIECEIPQYNRWMDTI